MLRSKLLWDWHTFFVSRNRHIFICTSRAWAVHEWIQTYTLRQKENARAIIIKFHTKNCLDGKKSSLGHIHIISMWCNPFYWETFCNSITHYVVGYWLYSVPNITHIIMSSLVLETVPLNAKWGSSGSLTEAGTQPASKPRQRIHMLYCFSSS